MGEADRYREFQKARPRFRLGQENNALAGLFVLNTVFFLILFTVKVVYNYYQAGEAEFRAGVLQWFQLSSSAEVFSERPWTIISYVFSDSSGEIFRLLSNMLWLWAFGYQLQQMAGNDKLIPVYLYGGVGGGIFFLVASAMSAPLHPQSGLLGANTGVLAVAAAATTVDPQFRILTHIRKGIPIWVLTAIYFLIDFAAIAPLPPAYKMAHFGAALTGFLFVILLRKGWDGSIWMNTF
ncbi:MAG: rhomboid family intramembrane serine protease, partial [Chitinophagaceae bacterium]